MKKIIVLVIVITIFILAFIVGNHVPAIADGSAVIIRDDFILSFIGVLAGFAIAIITFLFANLEQIRKNTSEELKLNEQSKTAIQSSISSIYLELKQDTLCIVVSLPVCLGLIIIRDWTDIVISVANVSKNQIIASIELAILLLTFIALIDIVISLFNLVKVSFQHNGAKK